MREVEMKRVRDSERDRHRGWHEESEGMKERLA